MITVRESVFILYDTENEVNVERVKLDVGTAADLPSADFLPGRRLYQGSTAHDISTGDLYAIDSTGTWYKQNRAGGGGGSAILIEKTISENGTYNATDDEADGYSKVVVDVPPPTLIDKTITANGEYLPAEDEATAYSKVVVKVAQDNYVYYKYGTFSGGGPMGPGTLDHMTNYMAVYKCNNGELVINAVPYAVIDGQTESVVINNVIVDGEVNSVNVTSFNYPTAICFKAGANISEITVQNDTVIPTGDSITSGDWYTVLVQWSNGTLTATVERNTDLGIIKIS